MTTIFDRETLLDALTELADTLANEGASATIRVVGGAAIAIGHSERAATADIDAVLYGDVEAVHTSVEAMAHRHGWPDGWLNDAVKEFYPFAGDPEWTEIIRRDGVSIFAAPADMLLAMKLNASRGSRDRPDITNLLVACNVEFTREAEEIFARYYPGEEMKERGRAQLTALFHEGG